MTKITVEFELNKSLSLKVIAINKGSGKLEGMNVEMPNSLYSSR